MSTHNYRALGRMKAGKMNKTEEMYAQRLELRKRAGEIKQYWFELLKIRLGENCFYTVDFFVLMADNTLEAHEVKGFMTEDAAVKIKVAAATTPFKFIVCRYKKKQWEFEEF